jgi:hexosaminidase
MPIPASVQMGSGSFKIDASFNVTRTGHSDARLEGALQRFLDRLGKQTGLLLPPWNSPTVAKLRMVVHVDHDSKPVQELGEDESYVLEVAPSGANISARTDLSRQR